MERLQRPERRISTQRTNPRWPISISSEDESFTTASLDLDRARRASAKLHDKTPKEIIISHTKRMTSRQHRTKDLESGGRHDRVSATKPGDIGESHRSRRHRRRRKEKDDPEASEDDFVYTLVEKSINESGAPSIRSRKDQVKMTKHKSSTAPDQAQTIATSDRRKLEREKSYRESRQSHTVERTSDTRSTRRRTQQRMNVTASTSGRSRSHYRGRRYDYSRVQIAQTLRFVQ